MSSSRQTPNTKPVLRFEVGLNQSSYSSFVFSHALLSLLQPLHSFGALQSITKEFFPLKEASGKGFYSTASVKPHHSGESPEISQKATMVVMQKPHQCICSVNPAGEPLLLRRCKISTLSHGIPQPRGQSTPDIQTNHSKADSSNHSPAWSH